MNDEIAAKIDTGIIKMTKLWKIIVTDRFTGMTDHLDLLTNCLGMFSSDAGGAAFVPCPADGFLNKIIISVEPHKI